MPAPQSDPAPAGPITAPTPRQQRREDLRAATLKAARDIIASDGPEALTARRLAQAAGYTPGTIYNLFDSLQDVIWEVNRDHFSRIAALFDDLPGDDPAARLRAVAARYLALITAEPTLFRALFEGPRVSDRFPVWYTDAIGALLGAIATELMQLAPGLTPADATREAAVLFAAIQGIAGLETSRRLDLLAAVPAADLADGLVRRMLRDIAGYGAC